MKHLEDIIAGNAAAIARQPGESLDRVVIKQCKSHIARDVLRLQKIVDSLRSVPTDKAKITIRTDVFTTLADTLHAIADESNYFIKGVTNYESLDTLMHETAPNMSESHKRDVAACCSHSQTKQR